MLRLKMGFYGIELLCMRVSLAHYKFKCCSGDFHSGLTLGSITLVQYSNIAISTSGSLSPCLFVACSETFASRFDICGDFR